MSIVLERPLLLPHALARRHLAGDVRLVVIHDTDRLVHHRVSERTWAVLSAMDGTRDVAGLVAYAALLGVTVSDAEVLELVADLGENGLVGERRAERKEAEAKPAASADLPIRQLPGFSFACDGKGGCCRFYPTIAFSPLDAARARSHQPGVLDGGVDETRVFLPMAGHARNMLAVTLVNGRCAYLQDDLGCGIHAVSGANQKPLGCRTYPARFIDDGEAIRVAPWLECACIFKSGTSPSDTGAPLLDGTLTRRSALDPAFFIESLPLEVLVGSGRRASRSEVVRWADAVAEAPLGTDGVAVFLALSRALELYGLDASASRDALAAPPAATEGDFQAALLAFTPHAERFAAETWRAPNDLVRVTTTALSSSVSLLGSLADELVAGPGSEAERFYVRAVLFGHQLVQPKALRPMSLLAFDRAFRLLLARSLAVVASLADLEDPTFQWPIALIDASLRGYGLSIYIRDLAVDASDAVEQSQSLLK